MENGLSEKRSGRITQYCSIMVALLAIGYVLIITNPPSDLLQYDNGKSVTVHLTFSNMSSHGGAVLIFLALFSLLSFLIGLLTSIIRESEGERKSSLIFYATSTVSVLVLGLLVYPYYGEHLVYTLWGAGVPLYFMGSFFSPSARARRVSLAEKVMLLPLLFEEAIIIVYFIIRILPIIGAVILLLLVALLGGLATGFALLDLMKGIQKYWREKHAKKPIPVDDSGEKEVEDKAGAIPEGREEKVRATGNGDLMARDKKAKSFIILPHTQKIRFRNLFRINEELSFVIQLEVEPKTGEWRPLVRYDCAHGFCHRDFIYSNGHKEKLPTGQNLNVSIAIGIDDLKQNLKSHVEKAGYHELSRDLPADADIAKDLEEAKQFLLDLVQHPEKIDTVPDQVHLEVKDKVTLTDEINVIKNNR